MASRTTFWALARSVPLLAALATATFFLVGGDARVIARWAAHWFPSDAALAKQRMFEAQVLGPHGVPVLVAGLTKTDRSIVRASEEGIRDLLKAWEQLPPEESTVGVLALSRELAEQAPQITPQARPAAERLIRLLLDWPLPSPSSAEEQLLADCHRALTRMPPAPTDASGRFDQTADRPTPGTPPEAAPSSSPIGTPPVFPSSEAQVEEVFPTWLTDRAGILPWSPVNVDALPLLPFLPGALRPASPAEPRRLDTPPGSRPPELFVPPEVQPLRAGNS